MSQSFTRRQLETNPTYARSFISWCEEQNNEDYASLLTSDEAVCDIAVYLWDSLNLEIKRLRGLLH